MPAVHMPDDTTAIPGFSTLAGELEAAGYDAVWTGEVNRVDAVTVATLAAVGTRAAQIGVLLNVFTRASTTLALTAATLAAVAPGRANVVLGVASPLLVERWAGIPYRQPFAHLRDTLRFVRAALTGERVRGDFPTIDTDGFTLSTPPSPAPKLLVAACGPRALALAAQEADGVVLNWVTPDDLDLVDPLPEDRSRVSFVVAVCPTADRGEMEQRMRPVVADYLQAPAYAEQQRRLGRGEALEAMWRAWAAGDRRGAHDALPSSLLDDLVVWGDAAACRDRIREMEAATGARPIATFFPPPGVDFADAALATDPSRS